MFVITTRNFPPEVGGMQTLMADLASNLVEHGPVQVFADSMDGDQEFDKKQKYQIERIKGFDFVKKYRKNNQVQIYCTENRNIRALIADHWKSIEKISDNICKQIPTLCLIHGKEINHKKGSLPHTRMMQSLKKAKYIIANSLFTKKLAVKKGIPAKKIKIINPGINQPKAIPTNFQDQAKEIFASCHPKLISVTRLEKRKGLHSVILSLKNLQVLHPNFLYVIVGQGEQSDSLKSLVRNMDLTSNIIFLEDVAAELKNALLNVADIFLMPSIEDGSSVEGFGISFLEASMQKTACIGGIVGGAADIIKDNKTGFLCDGTNHDKIYQALNKMIKNKRYIKMGEQAHKFAQKFLWKDQIKKYIKLI
jgi:phosphatidylinositol alpha-1,6-mannosyltransferase